jgi:hypothetical protein
LNRAIAFAAEASRLTGRPVDAGLHQARPERRIHAAAAREL